MAKRVCVEPGCPELVNTTRCMKHARARDKARGTRQERGYDAEYDAQHRELQRRMDAGETFWCWRCPELGRQPHLVDPRPGHWHLGHSNADRRQILGPQCPTTNLATAGPPRG